MSDSPDPHEREEGPLRTGAKRSTGNLARWCEVQPRRDWTLRDPASTRCRDCGVGCGAVACAAGAATHGLGHDHELAAHVTGLKFAIGVGSVCQGVRARHLNLEVASVEQRRQFEQA